MGVMSTHYQSWQVSTPQKLEANRLYLVELRQELALTQKVFYANLGLSHSTGISCESGSRKVPFYLFRGIANYLQHPTVMFLIPFRDSLYYGANPNE